MTRVGGGLADIPIPANGESSNAEPLLVVEHLHTEFSTVRGKLTAVDDVSLSLMPGETLGIVGESGAGKSILVRTIMDQLPASARSRGSIALGGHPIHQLPAAERVRLCGREIAMVFQNPRASLSPVKRIGQQIMEPMRYHLGVSRAQARNHAADLLALVRIPEPRRRLRQYPHQLSGGMLQRVAIARALACNPKVLIADEPTTALDVTVQHQILDLLAAVQAERKMGLLLITHDLTLMAGRAHRVMVMYGGRVVEEGRTEDIFDRMKHPYTAALFNATPSLSHAPHHRLEPIPGSSPGLLRNAEACVFADRCKHAQPRCLEESPGRGSVAGFADHTFACFFPIGSDEGELARRQNEQRGVTAAGLPVNTLNMTAGA